MQASGFELQRLNQLHAHLELNYGTTPNYVASSRSTTVHGSTSAAATRITTEGRQLPAARMQPTDPAHNTPSLRTKRSKNTDKKTQWTII